MSYDEDDIPPFAPGPWNVCERWPYQPDGLFLGWERLKELWIVGTRPGAAIAAVDIGGVGSAEANARLIAASPAMYDLAALVAADYPDAADWKDARGRLYAMASAIVERVRG